jgi:hypothetical protein
LAREYLPLGAVFTVKGLCLFKKTECDTDKTTDWATEALHSGRSAHLGT